MSAEEVCEAYRRGNNLVKEALDEGTLLAGQSVKCPRAEDSAQGRPDEK